MALANGDKAAICSVVVAVAIVLGIIIAYGPYTQGKQATITIATAPLPTSFSSTPPTTTAMPVRETSPSGGQDTVTVVITSVSIQNTAGLATKQIAQTTIPETRAKESVAISDDLSLIDAIDNNNYTAVASPQSLPGHV
ncbi:MAG TPA: hypothetical protein VHA09_03900 [Nitrososphaera sp.]|nr:hypothetical protein [Nitrososphaera sp.]